MIYSDMHCDALTASLTRGESLKDGNLQVTFEKLKKSGGIAQCFAIFTEGAGAETTFARCLALYKETLLKLKETAMPILSAADFYNCINSDKTGCILTVENLGFIGEDLSRLQKLHSDGVRMASLVWNLPNALAYPNLCPPENYVSENDGEKSGLPDWLFKRNNAPLTDLGRAAVEELDRLKIIIDISHLSDGGAEEILRGRKIPIVASHSNACAVCGVSRNLTDGQIKAIADCGGVIGINFCADFLGEKDAFSAVVRHLKHIMNVGGEDSVAVGSDFDGIPPTKNLEDCTRMPALFEFLERAQLPPRVMEKFAYKNFLRVFEEVCG